MGDGDKKDDEGETNEEGEDPEIAEARREAEERRKEKHRKMEEERENMRQSIRDKVNHYFIIRWMLNPKYRDVSYFREFPKLVE